MHEEFYKLFINSKTSVAFLLKDETMKASVGNPFTICINIIYENDILILEYIWKQ